jgi:hypothetical protein
MPWSNGRRNADPSLGTYAWKQNTGLLETATPPLHTLRRTNRLHRQMAPSTQPRVGHIISRHRARQLGWPDAQINALSNTQPECASCSNRSGAKLGRQIQDQTPVPITYQRPITAHRW